MTARPTMFKRDIKPYFSQDKKQHVSLKIADRIKKEIQACKVMSDLNKHLGKRFSKPTIDKVKPVKLDVSVDNDLPPQPEKLLTVMRKFEFDEASEVPQFSMSKKSRNAVLPEETSQCNRSSTVFFYEVMGTSMNNNMVSEQSFRNPPKTSMVKRAGPNTHNHEEIENIIMK